MALSAWERHLRSGRTIFEELMAVELAPETLAERRAKLAEELAAAEPVDYLKANRQAGR